MIPSSLDKDFKKICQTTEKNFFERQDSFKEFGMMLATVWIYEGGYHDDNQMLSLIIQVFAKDE